MPDWSEHSCSNAALKIDRRSFHSKVVTPTGLQEVRKFKSINWQTHRGDPAEKRKNPDELANLFEPPDLDEKAPVPGTTGAGAKADYLAGDRDTELSINGPGSKGFRAILRPRCGR